METPGGLDGKDQRQRTGDRYRREVEREVDRIKVRVSAISYRGFVAGEQKPELAGMGNCLESE